MATNFQRARSEEQRAQRRGAILDTAATMLTEMPVAQLSLNELSRRVGLAKSNVLRYFESREAVLLDLLGDASRGWLTDLEAEFAAAVDTAAGARERADTVAAVLASSLAARPVLCDLVSAQAAVLERNVSARIAAQYKQDAIANAMTLARLVDDRIPELGADDALRFAGATLMTTGAVWTHAQPSAGMLAAYEADPALASMRLDFTATLRQLLEIVLSGLLARRAP
ncbi:TetR/AcrR family transcriptional regulator [Actinacidiphila sp. ITFR-21]|uniref:TetR/AcrR family transcriptional regulator n=1 Tax=Actinacidiphila sp. ITFR-21 TaxID=3075199 RepID=UPI0028890FF9|nr:TetR family transcriptional regulator [Streptomyces sp. ITFR-21]WNI14852.1 TetR family transcriptional regulator [Streptomyces sp. ITFR-21]